MNQIINEKDFEKHEFAEIMRGIHYSSHTIVLDFAQIADNIPEQENIKLFFKECKEKGINPCLPKQRQIFHEKCLAFLKKKYLIGRYGEDRSAMIAGTSIAKEGRTIHLGIDIFCVNGEEVFCPYEGIVVRRGYEPAKGYGYYVIVEHVIHGKKWYSFFGHLAKNTISESKVKAEQRIGKIGDFKNNENGGWSRHLHYQILLALPPEGIAPPGYASPENFADMQKIYPDPNIVLRIPKLEKESF